MSSTDFLRQMADYLESQGIGYATASGSNSVNIFVGKQPATPDNCVTLLGDIPVIRPDPSISDLMFPRFQVIVRNTDYDTGSVKLLAVRTALHDKLAISLTNYFVWSIIADQEGYPIGEDSSGRPEFSIHFSARARYGDSI